MADYSKLLDAELETMTPFQRELHEAASADQTVESTFNHEQKQRSFSAGVAVEVPCEIKGEELVYTLDNKYNYAVYTFMRQILPPIRVRREYEELIQICWTRNLGLCLTRTSRICSGEDMIQHYDWYWACVNRQYFMKKDKRQHYDLMIGNVPFLIEWANNLPSFALNIPQLFTYCRDPVMSFPLCRCRRSVITQRYRIRSRISELVRMRRLVDGCWVDIPFNSIYLENMEKSPRLNQPRLFAYYSKIRPSELEWVHSDEIKPAMYVDDVITVTSEGVHRLGSTVALKLHGDKPCKAIFPLAENVESSRLRNWSNFTTNTFDLLQGWGPISKIKISYGGNPRNGISKIDYYDRVAPWFIGESCPIEPGYSLYPIAYEPLGLGVDVGTVFGQHDAKITLRLEDTDPYTHPITDDDDDDDIHDAVVDNSDHEASLTLDRDDRRGYRDDRFDGPYFRVVILMLVTRKIVFANDLCQVV